MEQHPRRAPAILTTSRLYGTPFRDGNEVELGLLDADPDVQALVFGTCYDADETRRRVEARVRHWNDYGFGDYVVRTAAGTFVGSVGLFHSPSMPGAVELGYGLRPEFWGRGYATELARAMVDVGFGALRLRRIDAVVLRQHAASRHVLEKAGFRLLGPDETDAEAMRYRVEHSP